MGISAKFRLKKPSEITVDIGNGKKIIKKLFYPNKHYIVSTFETDDFSQDFEIKEV